MKKCDGVCERKKRLMKRLKDEIVKNGVSTKMTAHRQAQNKDSRQVWKKKTSLLISRIMSRK